jgi:hypothetical protein
MIPARSASACSLGLTALVLTVACTGCNRSPFDRVPVSGVVTLDGQPLAGGIVNFQPIVVGNGVNGGPGSTARTGPDGRYTLATIRGEPGAVVGKHRVKIYSFNAETAKRTGNGGAPERERVPPRYNYHSTLTFDVPVAGTDKADFSLEAK